MLVLLSVVLGIGGVGIVAMLLWRLLRTCWRWKQRVEALVALVHLPESYGLREYSECTQPSPPPPYDLEAARRAL